MILEYPISRTWQGLVMVFWMAWRNAVFLGESLSMSRYDVVARRGWWKLWEKLSSLSLSSITTHSEVPAIGSSLSWNMPWELMVLMAISLGVCIRGQVRERKRVAMRVLGNTEIMGDQEGVSMTCWMKLKMYHKQY